MKWLLTFNIFLACAGLGLAQPIPGTLPHPTPLSTSPTVASPTLNGSGHWQESYSGSSSCNSGCAAAASKSGGSAFERLCEWLSFRPCPPVHASCVPQPPRAPLRTYFRHSECGVGCANATDCGSGCGKGRGCSNGNGCDNVYIPPAKRNCASANCGGSPMWGRGSSTSCGGMLGRVMGWFGLSEGSCGGGKGCGSCGGGCSNCQYTRVPMSDIGQYQNFTVTQSTGRNAGLSSTGAAPAGAHFANPYRAPSAELQYTQPSASLAPATPMPPPQQPMSQGTNPFPGPNGVLPYARNP